MRTSSYLPVFATITVCLIACGETNSTAPQYEQLALVAVKNNITAELAAMHAAATALQSAAPEADQDGWNSTADADVVATMKSKWREIRVAYERIEGAIAILFPAIDASTDERYDGFIAEGPDDNLFDGEGVTGVHGIERILWADEHPAHVTAFESALPNFSYASFPTTETEARDFKTKLLQRLIDDITSMQTDFEPLALDPAAAFRGVIGSMEEQLEKVNLASTGEDESRYAQHTLADMRANLSGAAHTFELFQEWLISLEGGETVSARVQAGLKRVDAAYSALPGDGIPDVPEGWNPDSPTELHLATDYGKLWTLLTVELDADNPDALLSSMLKAADALGIPQLP